jgi:BirA family biotin operon repressor/biotin-[acetyl-CoA-carboxylase] ligase
VIQTTGERESLVRAGRLAFPGFQLRALGVTTSTQDVVRAAARSGAPAGFCCMADSQSSGRGRQQRAWSAPPRSALLASVLVRMGHPGLGLLPIAAGLAVRAAIEATSGSRTLLKWPNDIMASGRKLAGILCEVEPSAAGEGTAVVIGIGVNLRVESFPDGVAGISLHELVVSAPTPSALFGAVLTELAARLARLEAGGTADLRSEWMGHATGIGSNVTAASAAGAISGVAEGIDEDGALLLRRAAGTVRVLAGDVHIEPPSHRS